MTFRMYCAHLVRGHQLNDCDSGSWYPVWVEAAVEGLSMSKDCPLAARPDTSKGRLRQLVRPFSLRDEFHRPAGLGWIPPFE